MTQPPQTERFSVYGVDCSNLAHAEYAMSTDGSDVLAVRFHPAREDVPGLVLIFPGQIASAFSEVLANSVKGAMAQRRLLRKARKHGVAQQVYDRLYARYVAERTANEMRVLQEEKANA